MARQKIPDGASVEYDDAAPARMAIPAGAKVEFDDDAPGPWRAGLVAHEETPALLARDPTVDTTPPPAPAPPEPPGILDRIAGIPGAIGRAFTTGKSASEDPEGAARSALLGARSTLDISGQYKPPAEEASDSAQKAAETKALIARIEGGDLSSFGKRAPSAGEVARVLDGLRSDLSQQQGYATTDAADARAVDEHKVAGFLGGAAVAGATPGGVIGEGASAAIPAATAVGRLARAGVVSGLAAGGDAATRTLVQGGDVGDALRAAGEAAPLGVAVGTLAHGATEAGTAALGKVIGGAPARVDARTLRALGKGATPEEQAALLQQKPDVMAEVKRSGLEGAPASRVAEVRKGVTAEKEAQFGAAERPTDADALVASLKARRDQLAANPAPEAKAQAKKLSAFIDNVAERWAKPTEPQAPAEPPEPPHISDAEALKQFAAAASKAARNEASGRLDDMTAVVKDFGLRQHINDPVGMKAAVDAGVDIAGRKLGNVDKVITEAGGGLPITSAMRGLDKVVQKYEGDPVAKDVAGRIGQVVENVRDAWRDKFPVVNQVTRVPLAEVRRMSGQIAESAFATDPTMPPKLATRIRRELYGALRDAMTEHIDEVAKANGLQDQVGDYAKLNRDYAALRTMKKITDPQAAAATMAPAPPPMTERAIPQPPPVPRSGKVKLSDMRMMAESFEPGSPERTMLEQAIADRVSEAPADIGAAISALSKREGALKAIEGPAARRETAAAFAEPKPSNIAATGFGTGLRAAQTIAQAAAPGVDRALAAFALKVHGASKKVGVDPQAIEEAVRAGVPMATVVSVMNAAGFHRPEGP